MPSSSQNRLAVVVQVACDGATVLTRNTRSARMLMAECDRVLGASAEAWETPAIQSFAHWMERTFRGAQVSGATDLALLNARQTQALWRQCIASSPGLTELLRPTSASGAASQAWQLAHGWRITLNRELETTAQGKAFLTWARKYQQLLERNRFTDAAMLPDHLRSLLPKIATQLPRQILLWGCSDLTPQERELIESLRNVGVSVAEGSESLRAVESASRIAFGDTKCELNAAAAYARELLLQDREKRIGIVVPKLASQRAMVESTFLRVLHPEYFVGSDTRCVFEISLGEPLSSYGLIRTAILLLRFSVEDLRFEEVRDLIRSPWLIGARQEADGRARLCRWLGGHAGERISASRLGSVLNPGNWQGHDRRELESMEVPLLRRCVDTIARRKGLNGRLLMSEWVRVLENWLRDSGWSVEGERALDSKSYQAYSKWSDLLSELASMDVVQGPVELGDAIREIVSAAGTQTFAPENRHAPVQIMDASEAAGSVFDHVWMCGMDDETWPPRRGADSFIPIRLQREAKVPGSSPESQVEEAQKTLERLLGSCESTIVSYARREGDRELRCSPSIVPATEVVWGDLNVSSAPSFRDRDGASLEFFTDEDAPATCNEELLQRGSLLIERQSVCPFRAFAECRLQAVKENEPRPGIAPTIRGNIIEYALQEFWKEARDLENWRGLGVEERKRITDKSVAEAMRHELTPTKDPAENKLRALERDRLKGLLDEWMEIEDKRQQFTDVRHQVPFTFTVAGVELHGRIDRIDRSQAHDGFVVIDYKASRSTAETRDGWQLPRPRKPQLPLYASYLKNEGMKVVGIAFGKIATADCKWDGIAAGDEVFGKRRPPKWAKPTLDEQIDDWKVEIEKVVSDHIAGVATVDPKAPITKSCEYCHLHSLCRVAEIVVIDEDEEAADE